MERKEICSKAANERWHPTMPKATHSGLLQIGGQELACDVLQDGTRIIRQKNFLKAMGRGKIGGKERRGEDATNLPPFLIANNLTPYLDGQIRVWASPIRYKGTNGQKYIGYDARLLPEACKVYVRAQDENSLQENQIKIASVCRTMLYGLATIGIIALVDSCTGYEKIRERTELERILSAYINEEVRQWTNVFPNSFFEQAYRIHGWTYPKLGKNHPQYLGKFINEYIYSKLPDGILDELKRRNPINPNGNRQHKHHQHLTKEKGQDHLEKQIVAVTTAMRLAKNLEQFKEFAENI
jgi:hypothetical protein